MYGVGFALAISKSELLLLRNSKRETSKAGRCEDCGNFSYDLERDVDGTIKCDSCRVGGSQYVRRVSSKA